MSNISFIHAIGREEGVLESGTRPSRNNNPGDLEYHDWQIPYGAKLEAATPYRKARFSVFPSLDQGYAALAHLLQFPLYRGKTVHEVLNEFAPPSDGNNTSSYEANVCSWVGCSPDTIVDTLL